MTTAILIPTSRPYKIQPLVENLHAVTPEPWFVVVVTKQDDSWPWGRVEAIADLGGTYIERTNRAARWVLDNRPDVSNIFSAGDDLVFHRHWLSELLAMQADVDGVVVPVDLYNPRGTNPLLSVNYLRTLGGTRDDTGLVYHEGYRHMFCDCECFLTAIDRNRYARCFTSIVEHMHWEAGKAPKDEVHSHNVAAWDHDSAIFHERWGDR